VLNAKHSAVTLREIGGSSTPRLLGSIATALEYWVTRLREGFAEVG